MTEALLSRRRLSNKLLFMYIFILTAICGFLFIGYTDYRTYKITNHQILMMIILFAVWKSFYFDDFFWLDLGVGLALFAVGFVAWLLKGIGAGDAKLFFVAGIYSGYQYAGYFALLLFLTGLFFALLILVARRAEFLPVILFGRLIEIGKTRKVPYGVPLSASTIGALVVRLSMG